MNIKIIPPNVDYALEFYQWRNEPSTLKFNPVKNRTLEELKEILRNSPTCLSPLDTKAVHRWFIDLDDKIVGTVSLSEIDVQMGTAEIGYMIGEAHHNRGIATAALRTWTSFIFQNTDLRKLTASVSDQNLASIRVLEKVGYKREGLLREHYLIQEIPTNEVVFGLLRKEWT